MEANTTELPEDLATINQQEPMQALEIILRHAVKMKASDIFFHCNPKHYVVSIRRLGTVQQLVVLSGDAGVQAVNRIKSSGGMDLSERRQPQDGRWVHQIDDLTVSCRVNSIGTIHGEDVVLRILPTSGTNLKLESLGFVGDQFASLRSMLNSGSGLLLVTGPTGAGKSTTLYACLDFLNDGKRAINTLEDPIEHVIKGVRQSQIVPKIGLGFLELLRGVLRQSPDVIMIGEIRDEETARTAVRAANSGHLVLSTLHSPLAAGAVQSMLAFGVNPYFLSNCLLGIVAQRLIRELSPDSRQMFDVSHSPETFKEISSFLEPGEGNVIYGPDENDANSQHGYVGQSGLFEILMIDRKIKELVAAGAGASEIHEAAKAKGMLDFSRAALLKVAKGQTGVEEMSRVIPTLELAEYE